MKIPGLSRLVFALSIAAMPLMMVGCGNENAEAPSTPAAGTNTTTPAAGTETAAPAAGADTTTTTPAAGTETTAPATPAPETPK